MKKNFVILYEIEFDSKNGYEVAINTPLGVFKGYTEADEIDAQYPSSFHAGEIALSKALRKYCEAAVNQLKREIKLLDGMVKQSIDFAKKDKKAIDNNSFRILHGTFKQKKKELIEWEQRIQNLTKKIVDRIVSRDKIVKDYITKEDKKD